MSELLDKLNNKQREAVEYMDGPLLILAGAGSGKTRVLTYKIAYLLEQGIVKPWQILAITFTNKAAKEMKERVEALVGQVASDMWLGTFHSVCVRILKREIELLGYTRDFNIFDEIDKEKVIKEIMKKNNIDEKVYPVGLLKSEISKAKEVMKDEVQYQKDAMGDYRKEEIAKIYNMYQATLRKNNSIDFDDIIMLTVKLFLENPDRLMYYQDKFNYILVDEYQDTNKTQFLLISLLSSGTGNICVVGDESQSIYGFRGADISNILNFESEFPNAKIIKLEENYRSTKNILNAANEVIKNNKSKIDKELWTQNDDGEKLDYKTLNNEYEEVEFVVDKIDEVCRKQNQKYSDFAVLFRTNAQARVLEEVFMKSGTPYKLIGGIKFYARKEIKDIISYLKLIQNTNDNIALKRIINEPKRGIGDTALDKLDMLATESGISIFELIQNSNNLAGIRSAGNIMLFRDMMNDLIKLKDTMKVSELIKRVLKDSGYEDMLNSEGTKETEIRFDNLMEFIGVAMEFENENAENTLGDFLESIALVSDVDNLDESTEAVTLMTMHSAKGLEFENVFLVGMEEGLFPSKRSIEEDYDTEEERRLCYVAITRAKQHLYITNTKKRTLYGSTSYSIPSRFIDEIPETLLSAESLENKEGKKQNTTSSWLDSEYKRVETYISNRNRVNETVERKVRPNVGISVDSFLKNLAGTTVAPKPAASSAAQYKIGMEVKHKKFGVGIIENIEPEGDDFKLEIMFDGSGFKRLMANYTPLEILSDGE
ncbi:MAG: DNA helicase PcrA [Clostridia bacterium]|nr:DNA helicase PcrA [Clostridia bacterium]